MKLFAICALLLTCTWASPTVKVSKPFSKLRVGGSRIIDGEKAALGQFPWQVLVRLNTATGPHYCGGSLISDQWVLTAGHCVEGATSFDLQLGTIDSDFQSGVSAHSTKFIRHEGYNEFVNNDIAVINLDTPVTLNNNIKTIKLPNRGDRVGAGEKATVSGWGKVSDASTTLSPKLNYVELETISNKQCELVFGPLLIIESTVCVVGTGHKSPCNGDSGGPLVQYDSNGEATHIGIVSFGSDDGCERGYPGAFVRTESFLDWIKDNTGIDV